MGLERLDRQVQHDFPMASQLGQEARELHRLAEQTPPYVLPNDAPGWPLDTIDVVRWAGLKERQLDRSGFTMHWRRYMQARRGLALSVALTLVLSVALTLALTVATGGAPRRRSSSTC